MAKSASAHLADDNWRAKTKVITKPRLIRAGYILCITALVAALVVALSRKPAELPASVEKTSLSDIEESGVKAILADFAKTAHEIRGTITGAYTLGIDVSTTSSGRTGFGDLTAKNIQGSALLVDGVTYIKGSSDFWQAIGVENKGFTLWVRLPQGGDFVGSRVFTPASAVVAALTPDARAKIFKDDYQSTQGSAKFGKSGLTHLQIPGYTGDIIPADSIAVQQTVDPQIGTLRGSGTLSPNQDGTGWVIKVSAPPAPPAPPRRR